MIALKNGLPLVRDDTGTVASFDTVWLRSTLSNAAAKAGYHGWWLVDDLAAGITLYLRHGYLSGVIDLPKLETVIRTVLHDVGYREIALRYQTVMPCHRISLVQCLEQRSPKDHHEFFDCLGERIAGLHASKPRHVHFSDLQECLSGLIRICPAVRASGSATLLHEVVTFVRARVEAFPWHSLVRCSIS